MSVESCIEEIRRHDRLTQQQFDDLCRRHDVDGWDDTLIDALVGDGWEYILMGEYSYVRNVFIDVEATPDYPRIFAMLGLTRNA